MVRRLWTAAGTGRKILFVHTDVKAGLLELLFHVDLALLHERQKVASQPCDLSERQAVLGDVDRLSGEVRGGGLALCRGRIAVDVQQVLLEFDGADGGVDL